MIIKEEPWWVVIDVCTAFEIVNHKRTLSDLAKNYKEIQMDIDWVRRTYPIPDALGRPQETTIIKEAGVYAIAFQSRKKL